MNTTMTCLVIDDEPVAIDILQDYIAKVPFLELLQSFRESIKALEFLQQNNVDLIFLDINMPDLSGIQFLNALSHHPLVIFTTAYSQYAVESYEYEAVDYLLKPIEFPRFLKAANRALELYQLKTKNSSKIVTSSNNTIADDKSYILIKSGSDIHRIEVNDICYVKGTGNYVTFHTIKKKILSLLTMNKVLEILPHRQFVRIHKSYIINFNRIDVIEKEQVKIRDVIIPIGEVYRVNLLRLINEIEN